MLTNADCVLPVPATVDWEYLRSTADPSSGDAGEGSISRLYQFLATPDGARIARSFSRIKNKPLRAAIVKLLESLGDFGLDPTERSATNPVVGPALLDVDQ